jgi:hypothetical protein
MTAPATPKPTRKSETLARAPPTVASRREEDVALKEWPKPWLSCVNGILETKANDGSTAAKAPAPRTNPKAIPRPSTPSSPSGFTSASILHILTVVNILTVVKSERKKLETLKINNKQILEIL